MHSETESEAALDADGELVSGLTKAARRPRRLRRLVGVDTVVLGRLRVGDPRDQRHARREPPGSELTSAIWGQARSSRGRGVRR